MKIFYGKGAYQRQNGNLPELKLINMFVEQTPANEDGVVLLSRRGLTQNLNVGLGPITGVFRQDGVFSGDTFAVSGGNLYRLTDSIGTILGSGPASFAASETELGINAGGSIYRYDGSSFGMVTFPDGQNVRKLLYHDGLFFAIPTTGDSFYASGVLDLATWNALAFKSAESDPDQLLDGEFLSDTLYLFGQDSIEPWDNNSSGDTVPYSRRELGIINKGIKATGCVVNMDQALWFISNENMLMSIRDGAAPQRVSDHGIEERIENSTTASVFGYVYEGHSFVGLRLDQGTWFLDIATGQFYEAQTLGLSNVLVQCATKPGEPPLFGSSVDGAIYEFGGWADGAYPLERRFTAAIPLDGGAMSIDVLSIQANAGWAESGSPTVEMRTSRDAGATWDDWRAVSLGSEGEYRARVRWRRCGMFDEPGALIEFRTSDPVGFRVSGVFVNEPGGGRSR